MVFVPEYVNFITLTTIIIGMFIQVFGCSVLSIAIIVYLAQGECCFMFSVACAKLLERQGTVERGRNVKNRSDIYA